MPSVPLSWRVINSGGKTSGDCPKTDKPQSDEHTDPAPEPSESPSDFEGGRVSLSKKWNNFLSWFSPLNVLELQIILVIAWVLASCYGIFFGFIKTGEFSTSLILLSTAFLLAICYRTLSKYRRVIR